MAEGRFLGGHPALDFANTIDWRLDPARRRELLPDYAALLDWARARGMIGAAAAGRLRPLAASPAAAAAHGAALMLRDEIIAAATALEAGTAVPLTGINARLAGLPAMPGLVAEGGGAVPDLPGVALDEPVRPVLWAAATLLTGPAAPAVRCCAAQGCGWFFLDATRRRLWCDSAGCGNRERVRRAYARRK